jgi:hypothetical protein
MNLLERVEKCRRQEYKPEAACFPGQQPVFNTVLGGSDSAAQHTCITSAA